MFTDPLGVESFTKMEISISVYTEVALEGPERESGPGAQLWWQVTGRVAYAAINISNESV